MGKNFESRRFFSMLSLCKKSGQLVSGEAACENAVRSGKARLIIISCDASKNTSKKFVNSSIFYKIPIFKLDLPKAELGGVIGESARSVIAIIGDDFMNELKVYLTEFEYSGGGPIV